MRQFGCVSFNPSNILCNDGVGWFIGITQQSYSCDTTYYLSRNLNLLSGEGIQCDQDAGNLGPPGCASVSASQN